MRHFMLALTSAAALLVFGSLAPGQSPTAPRVPDQSTVKLTMEQEHTIKELLKELKIESETGAVPETVGAAIPSDIKPRPIPEDIGKRVPQIKSHMFFIKGDRIFLVDTKDNTIAEVID